jgi:DNA-binding SARP family transcriptional activator
VYFIHLLGGASLEGPDGPVGGRVVQRHPLCVIALLALAPGHAATRDRIVGLLWPDSTEERARNRLRTTLHAIRELLGSEAVLSAGDDLILDPDRVRSDVGEFEGAIRSGDLEAAVDLYRGPFMDGFHLQDGNEFEQWMGGERDRLRMAYEQALQTLAQGATDAGQGEVAARLWHRLVQEVPYDELTVLRAMEAAALAGHRVRAISYARRYEAYLRHELGAEPSAEVTRLAGKIKEHPEADAVLAAWSTGERQVVVCPIEGSEGTAEVRRMAEAWILEGLSHTGYMSVVQADRAPDGDETAPVRPVGSGPIEVRGSYFVAGEEPTFKVRFVDRRGEVRGTLSVVDRGGDGTALDELRDRVTGLAARIFHPHLGRWAGIASDPPSYEAHVAFAEALEAQVIQRSDGQLRSRWRPIALAFEEAAAPPSGFTAPLIWALRSWISAEDPAQLTRLMSEMRRLRSKMPPWEQAMLDYHVALLDGDRQRAREAAKRAVEVAPDPESVDVLARSHLGDGDPLTAVAVLEAHGLLAPDGAPSNGSIRAVAADALHIARRHEQELRLAKGWLDESPDHPAGIACAVRALAALGRGEEALGVALDALSDWVTDSGDSVHVLSEELEWHGHGGAAARLARATLETLDHRLTDLHGSVATAARARLLRRAGDLEAARVTLEGLSDEATVPGEVGLLGVLAVASGAQELAREMVSKLEGWDPSGPRRILAPPLAEALAWRGAVSASRGDIEQGMKLLRQAFRSGLPVGPWLHTDLELGPFQGIPGSEELVHPRRL